MHTECSSSKLFVEFMSDISDLQKKEFDPAKLRAIRGGLSREVVGKFVGVGSSAIANYENRVSKPSANTLLRLMILYNAKAEDLVKSA